MSLGEEYGSSGKGENIIVLFFRAREIPPHHRERVKTGEGRETAEEAEPSFKSSIT